MSDACFWIASEHRTMLARTSILDFSPSAKNVTFPCSALWRSTKHFQASRTKWAIDLLFSKACLRISSCTSAWILSDFSPFIFPGTKIFSFFSKLGLDLRTYLGSYSESRSATTRHTMTTKRTQKRNQPKPAANRVNISLPDELYAPLAEEAQKLSVPEATMVRIALSERYQHVRAAN